MKCRKHPQEVGVGVCASCLRERLFAVIAAEIGRSPPPLSASPSPSRFRRFFSTPQVGSAANSSSYHYDADVLTSTTRKFSLLSSLFGYPRSDDVKPRSTSFFSRLAISVHIKNKKKSRSRRIQDRGMSPAHRSDSPCSSGYSTASPAGWRRPEPTPVRRFHSNGSVRPSRGVAGFAVCLSPLVRPATKPAGDPRGTCARHLRRHVSAEAASLVPNRSRKLADYGRFR